MTETARQRPFNPATKAIQFRAWQIAQREAGNITREQIAAEMGETTSRVSRLLRDDMDGLIAALMKADAAALAARMAAA